VGYNAVAYIRLVVVASQICEIQRNSKKFELKAVQGHPRSLILVSIENAYATCYQSSKVTFDISPTVFEILTFKDRNTLLLVFPTSPLTPPLGEPIRISGWNLTCKNKSYGATVCWKFHNPIFNHFWLIHPCDGQTDGRAIAYSALSIYAVAR